MEKADTRGLGTKEDRGHEGRVGEREEGGAAAPGKFQNLWSSRIPNIFLPGE